MGAFQDQRVVVDEEKRAGGLLRVAEMLQPIQDTAAEMVEMLVSKTLPSVGELNIKRLQGLGHVMAFEAAYPEALNALTTNPTLFEVFRSEIQEDDKCQDLFHNLAEITSTLPSVIRSLKS